MGHRGAGGLSSRRQAFNAFVTQHELAWDVAMAALALIYIATGLLEDHPPGMLRGSAITTIE
ncbi:MAG TPA: hypothetical protein VJO72_15125, partial [Candidatus Dormibacteraeota bacterium]|nr:hypothetical protein [Candidatus Dormibacteraeota bacterium]